MVLSLEGCGELGADLIVTPEKRGTAMSGFVLGPMGKLFGTALRCSLLFHFHYAFTLKACLESLQIVKS